MWMFWIFFSPIVAKICVKTKIWVYYLNYGLFIKLSAIKKGEIHKRYKFHSSELLCVLDMSKIERYKWMTIFTPYKDKSEH